MPTEEDTVLNNINFSQSKSFYDSIDFYANIWDLFSVESLPILVDFNWKWKPAFQGRLFFNWDASYGPTATLFAKFLIKKIDLQDKAAEGREHFQHHALKINEDGRLNWRDGAWKI